MMIKTLLLATFISPEKLDWFLTYLEEEFEILRDKVFIFENLDAPSRLIVTFKMILHDGVRINLKQTFPNATQIHKRGTAIYTINALNKLIIRDFNLDIGNIDYKNFKINWDNYQDRLIMNNNGELTIYKIKRVFL